MPIQHCSNFQNFFSQKNFSEHPISILLLQTQFQTSHPVLRGVIFHSLFVTRWNSLVARGKICSLLVAEVGRCKKSEAKKIKVVSSQHITLISLKQVMGTQKIHTNVVYISTKQLVKWKVTFLINSA